MYFDEDDLIEADQQHADIDSENSCPCDHCGEEIQIQVDLSQGASQQFVEDCSVC
jgi:hypothetical protein